jgi:VIT1/CCC1 family predicted Fe2+/Mn2+ transporter
MTRSALRREIAKRLEGAAATAKTAATGKSGSYRMYKNLDTDLEDKNVLSMFIKAEIEVAEELEELRTKGGRRSTPIPKQF